MPSCCTRTTCVPVTGRILSCDDVPSAMVCLLRAACTRQRLYSGRPRRRQRRNEGRKPAMTVRSKNHDWLALTVEDPLDPDLPICDPHHHLWDLQPARVAPRYLLDEIVADAGAGHQIPDVTSLARAFPGTTIILNHFGGPLGIGPYAGRAKDIFAEWRKSISELATCPNVVAKLGGINMEINGFGWHERPRPPESRELAEATRHYYEFTIERFGVDRCMFESNFPVDKASCSYTVLWDSFKRLTSGFSAAERTKLFHDTAARVYRL